MIFCEIFVIFLNMQFPFIPCPLHMIGTIGMGNNPRAAVTVGITIFLESAADFSFRASA